MRDKRGIIYSTTLHGIILFFLLVGLPDFFHRQLEVEPEAISVDILPISPISNVKPQDQALPQEEKKKPVEEKNTAKKAAPETRKAEPKPQEKAEVTLPDKKKPVKKEEKKPEKKPVEDPLKAVLNDVKEHAKQEESDKPTQEKTVPNEKPAKSQTYDASLPLSMSEKDAIRGQIEKCWNPPVGAKDAQNLVVTLHIQLNQDGSLVHVELAHDESRYASDSFFRAAADSAIRAVQRCTPLKSLPTEKYGTWQDMELGFDPHESLN